MKKNKGVLTVEAALMVPLFVFAILFMTQFMKVVYVYDTVQTNIHNTAKFINSYSYLNHKADGAVQENIQKVQQIFTSVILDAESSKSDITEGDSSSDSIGALKVSLVGLINDFIGQVLKNGYNSGLNSIISKICKEVINEEINPKKQEWLGIKGDFDFTESKFTPKETKIIVKYSVNISSPFINIDKDIPLKNQVVIKKLATN